MLQISPSILACDFTNLEREVCAMQQAGAHMIHVDVMDGHFVPNITIGLPVVSSLRKKTDMPLDVHLMISDPLTYAPQFAAAGADIVVFHLESDSDVQQTLDAIAATGKKRGISLKPGTPAEALFPYLSQLDLVLIMTVEPGFGGQSFQPEQCQKVAAIRAERDRLGLSFDIEVDGGIDTRTIGQATAAGANVFVAGSALFGKPDYSTAVQELLTQAKAAL